MALASNKTTGRYFHVRVPDDGDSDAASSVGDGEGQAPQPQGQPTNPEPNHGNTTDRPWFFLSLHVGLIILLKVVFNAYRISVCTEITPIQPLLLLSQHFHFVTGLSSLAIVLLLHPFTIVPIIIFWLRAPFWWLTHRDWPPTPSILLPPCHDTILSPWRATAHALWPRYSGCCVNGVGVSLVTTWIMSYILLLALFWFGTDFSDLREVPWFMTAARVSWEVLKGLLQLYWYAWACYATGHWAVTIIWTLQGFMYGLVQLLFAAAEELAKELLKELRTLVWERWLVGLAIIVAWVWCRLILETKNIAVDAFSVVINGVLQRIANGIYYIGDAVRDEARAWAE